MRRIGIFGGTFDPIHLGHLILAEQCREPGRLDQVWFVPAGNPPHKQEHASRASRSASRWSRAGHCRPSAFSRRADRTRSFRA